LEKNKVNAVLYVARVGEVLKQIKGRARYLLSNTYFKDQEINILMAPI